MSAYKAKAAQLPKALKLIEELRWELVSELHAAGSDEIRVNPTLKKKERLADRAQRFLERSKK